MLENLSPNALACFEQAKDQARRLKSTHLDTPHLLLGMLACQPRLVTPILEQFSVRSEALAKTVEKLAEKGQASPSRLIVADGVKATLRRSQEIATGGLVTPACLLAAVIESDTQLAQALEQLGADPAEVVKELKQASLVESATIEESPPSAASSSAKPRKTPLLEKYGRDLTNLARQGELPPIVGRAREMLGLMEILCRQTKRNPILVGEPGVGKTALVEGLARKIVTGDVPAQLQDKRLIELSLSSLTAGAGRVGEFEQRVEEVVKETRRAGNVLLFIDEVHALLGAGGMPGLQDAATLFKPALARGEITCIGATTTHDYRKYIEPDGALARRFQTVRVEEPAQDVTMQILNALRPRLEGHFGVVIPEPLLADVYESAKQYLKNRYFPDKAVDLIERAGSRALLVDGAATTVTRDHLLSVLSDLTGVPLERLEAEEMDRFLQMEEILGQRVVGQPQAIEAVARLVRLTKRRLDVNPNRPDGVFMFCGPVGVGKTELARALAEFLFGDEERLIRLDMSEYTEPHAVSRLVGSPPGYIGYDEEGQLTSQVMSHPFCVILLDELDKAHPNILNMFLQVFDDGRLTDSHGRTALFSDASIILTTNLDSALWRKGGRRQIGFAAGERRPTLDQDTVLTELRKRFSDDFLARVDEVVTFHPLDAQATEQIARVKLDKIVRERFARQAVSVSFDDGLIEHVATRGCDVRTGARQLERFIQRHILEPLAEQSFSPDWTGVKSIQVSAVEGHVQFSRTP
ncbi:MAG: ATP-dependent Clp protease ATP-binding subunit [Thermoflexales bacterium]|nr:ATP-dependent Clp protease ATP-binding subunit [Thermoflexales bacterium]